MGYTAAKADASGASEHEDMLSSKAEKGVIVATCAMG